MTDPDLLDAQHQAEALLADAAEAVSLREQLDVALRQLGEWREEVARLKRASGARKCPDCGSLRFDRGGAAALDEARREGWRQGVESAAKACEEEAERCIDAAAALDLDEEDGDQVFAQNILLDQAGRIRSLTLSDEVTK